MTSLPLRLIVLVTLTAIGHTAMASHLDREVPFASGDELTLSPDQEPGQGAALEAAAPSVAPMPPAPNTPFGAQLTALGDETLTQIRGGFVTDAGLKISFGIERAVFINGDLVTTTRFSTQDMAGVTAGRASDAGNTVALIQNGGGNVFLAGATSPSSMPSIVQNTLDNQAIRTVTIINASINSLELLRSSNLAASVRNSIADALRH